MTPQHPAAPETKYPAGAIVPERQRCICEGVCLDHCRACNYSGRDLEEPCIADPDWEPDDDDLARREGLPAAPETETDANGLRELLAAGFAAGWASVLDDDDAEFVQTDPQAMRTAYYYADLIAPTVERIVAERVRVVEGERDALMQQQPFRVAESNRLRAESAEAAHEALVSEVEALARDLAARAEGKRDLATETDYDVDIARFNGEGTGLGMAHMLVTDLIQGATS